MSIQIGSARRAPGTWRRAFEPLWRACWATYLEEAGDEVLEAAPPFLAWRALVLGCPRFYPDLPGEVRQALLGWAEGILARPRFHPEQAGELFA